MMDMQTEEQREAKKKPNQVDPSIQCLFSRKACKRKRLRGFDFCHKHILEDKNSPFQQCSFIIKSTEERCINPAPKAENKKTFCLIHTRDPKLKKAHDEIMRRNLKRKLDQRKAVADAKKASSESTTTSTSQKSTVETKRSRDEETLQISALEMPEADGIYALQDNGGIRHDVAWFGENDSDAESVDSEEEDPLRHAGVWTLEEALKICRDKMIRKRSLYLEQYKRLHILLKERRRRHIMRTAASSYQHESSNSNDAPSETALTLTEQRALGLYQHVNGIELLLEKQSKEKRLRGSTAPKVLPQNRCLHVTDLGKCQDKVLPFSKFCLQHICFNSDQRLYKKCTFEPTGSNPCCNSPVAQIYRSTTCDLHTAILPRYSSDALNNIINPVEKTTSSSDPAEGSINLDMETSFEATKAVEKIQEEAANGEKKISSRCDLSDGDITVDQGKESCERSLDQSKVMPSTDDKQTLNSDPKMDVCNVENKNDGFSTASKPECKSINSIDRTGLEKKVKELDSNFDQEAEIQETKTAKNDARDVDKVRENFDEVKIEPKEKEVIGDERDKLELNSKELLSKESPKEETRKDVAVSNAGGPFQNESDHNSEKVEGRKVEGKNKEDEIPKIYVDSPKSKAVDVDLYQNNSAN